MSTRIGIRSSSCQPLRFPLTQVAVPFDWPWTVAKLPAKAVRIPSVQPAVSGDLAFAGAVRLDLHETHPIGVVDRLPSWKAIRLSLWTPRGTRISCLGRSPRAVAAAPARPDAQLPGGI